MQRKRSLAAAAAMASLQCKGKKVKVRYLV